MALRCGRPATRPSVCAASLLDEVITVDTDEICAAVKDIFEDTRAIAEPSGAVGLAGLKKYAEREGSQRHGADRRSTAAPT